MPSTIQQGSKGADVKQWQGIIGITADGDFGPATDAATKKWQAQRGITPDGVVGPATWSLALGTKVTMPKPQVPDLRTYVEGHEGRRAKVYLDTEGHPTVGVGFNLDRPDARSKLAALGLDYDAVVRGDVTLSNAQIDRLFDITLAEATAGAQKLVPNFASLKKSAQIVLIDMVFNMGVGGVAGFTMMLGALSRKDYSGAVAGMRNSKWATQVGSRATNDMALMLLPAAAVIGAGTLLMLAAIVSFAILETRKS